MVYSEMCKTSCQLVILLHSLTVLSWIVDTRIHYGQCDVWLLRGDAAWYQCSYGKERRISGVNGILVVEFGPDTG